MCVIDNNETGWLAIVPGASGRKSLVLSDDSYGARSFNSVSLPPAQFSNLCTVLVSVDFAFDFIQKLIFYFFIIDFHKQYIVSELRPDVWLSQNRFIALRFLVSCS